VRIALLADTRCALFRRDVALRRAKQLVADHKLPHGRRTQQRRVEMRVQMPVRPLTLYQGTLVEAIEWGKARKMLS
jgi:hypothetical protein